VEYAPAQGRFIRGIDPNGKIDPDGKRALESIQEDAFKSHTHNYQEWRWQVNTGNGPYKDGLTANVGNKPAVATSSTGDTETRPKNVALLYCMRKI
jgi:hypothetical protein